ncbi:MAG: filamentous hemagglutinin family protein, partial [Myxococcota bacterium]
MKNQMNQKQNNLITKASPRTEARLRDHYSRGQRRVAWLTLFCFFVSPATAFADATETSIGNANTIDGTFTENTEANTTFDQSTQSAVIHWDQMDQQANNTLTFIQSKNESVLNQAQGVTASVFRGMVKCGGECIFANEAGVTFADGSYLDVGRLVAVAGTVDEGDFRAGKLHATGVTGKVTNFGEIHADSAVLIGARISNGGELYIANGSLTAVVGNEVWITEHDSNVIIHAPIPDPPPGTTRGSSDGGEFDEEPAIDNSGTIDAGGGKVRMLAGDMLAFAIRNTGTIRAQEIALEADSGLVEVSGNSVLDASSLEEGGVGGSIKVLGDYVAIADNAILDASGHSGGGEVLVGGDRAGADGTHTSQGTYVGKNTTLRADATHSGDGGKVIVWSDKTTRSYGAIRARGGVLSGNGGFVETSGLETLDVTNSPLVHARSGNADDRGGEWLLDPFNIDIVSSCTGADCLGDALEEAGSYDPDLFFSGTVTSDNDETVSQVGVDLIKQVLLTGSNVTITTEGAGSDQGNDIGDINFLVDADLLFVNADGALPSTEATLTLLAANNLTIDADINNGATDFTLNLDFRANADQPEKDADEGARGNEYFGDLNLNGEIHTGGGSADLSGVNVTLNNVITTGGRSAFVLAEGGDAVLTDAALIDTRSAGTGGSATVVALARVTEGIPADPTDAPTRDDVLGGNVLVANGAQISTGGGSVTVTGGNDAFSRLNDTLGGNVTFGGMIDSGGGRVTLEAHRAFNTSSLETTHFGGRIRIDRDAQVRSNGGRINIEASLESLTSGGDDGRTRVQIFGEVDSRVYDAGVPDVDERGGDIELVSRGFQTGAIEIEDLRTNTGDSLIATNGGDFVAASSGTTKVISGTIDTQFAGTQPAEADADAIKGTISIGSIGLTSLQATPNDIALLADERINLTGGLDGNQRLSIDTTRGNITISADAIQLAAGNGPDGNTNAQVDLSRANNGLQFTNGAGDGNPLDFTIGQDASIDASNIPTAEMFQNGVIDGVIDVDTFSLQTFDGELTLANIDITSSDSLSLGARTGINFEGTTALNLAGATLNVEVYESFTVESSHANVFNATAVDELNISAGVIEGVRNTSEEAGLTIAASLTSRESMTLRGGVGGSGDVTFEGSPTLTTQNLTLWAGDGGATDTASRVVAINPDTGTGLVNFDLDLAAPAFMLRQSASITDENIPNVSQFINGIDGVDYTLRSDAGAIGGEETIDST